MDEKPLQLPADARAGTPAAPGQVAREDSEYIRCGTCSIFVWAEPLRGWRRAYAESTRTRGASRCARAGIRDRRPATRASLFDDGNRDKLLTANPDALGSYRAVGFRHIGTTTTEPGLASRMALAII